MRYYLSGFHHKDLRSLEMKVKTHKLLHVRTKEELCAQKKRRGGGLGCLRGTFDHDRYHRWESGELLATDKRLFHVRGSRGLKVRELRDLRFLCGNRAKNTNRNLTLQKCPANAFKKKKGDILSPRESRRV